MFSANNSQVSSAANYIEDVFSTYLYTGTGNSTGPTVANGLDLSTYGGLVWTKARDVANAGHMLLDTVRGGNSVLTTSGDPSYLGGDGTAAAAIYGSNIRNFLTNGFNIRNTSSAVDNNSGSSYASWSFRKQAKFFDIVTWTGDGNSSKTISHALGSAPGCIVSKVTNTTQNWIVYHRSLPLDPTYPRVLFLNTTSAQTSNNGAFYLGAPTSTTFSVGADMNVSGNTYIAYLYAHNAGGFGLTGTDNVISCGSFTTDNAGNVSVNLEYEPQYLLLKRTDSAGSWITLDVMRGWAYNTVAPLYANSYTVEGATYSDYTEPTSTGFQFVNGGYLTASANYIYVAIRRGPMKAPTLGTNVFYAGTRTGTAAVATVDTASTFPTDLTFNASRNIAANKFFTASRLIGNPYLVTRTTGAESQDNSNYAANPFDTQTGIRIGDASGGFGINLTGNNYIDYLFRRAPSYFDEVCYKGTGSDLTVNHNLTVTPELIIFKDRTTAGTFWITVGSVLPNGGAGSPGYGTVNNNNVVSLNTTNACSSGDVFSALPSSTSFGVSSTNVGVSGKKYVAYLFATCTGVSKVGSYTGTGTLTTINCGFTGGARFVMIKRTDSTGNWFVWDTTRGMVAGTDPSLAFNLQNAESNANSVYTATTGFQLLASPAADVNTSGGTYIYLAIA